MPGTAPPVRRQALAKFLASGLVAAAAFTHAILTYTSGTMVGWYYYRASADGYAVNTRAIEDATPARPARLLVAGSGAVDGNRAVMVRTGDRLPSGATGVIDRATVDEGRRARLDGEALLVLVPWQVRESRGVLFREGFTHQNVRTNPLSGVWNLAMVLVMGLSLGLKAEGFTDLIGVRLRKSEHTVNR